ncbi:hypothetical protein [Acidovorax sp. SUPP2825]|uniref:hypothetical protein n=1 Tax=Acidovorax sp. SUPP2825 TaxID=2920879 RepID=UPI0023DE28B8|nr:hypothetical protein [Acidovorax sp. SUPP2825]GKS97317.1 DUF4684 domain-containing protein [Acidovorax sp. SUPP2825]
MAGDLDLIFGQAANPAGSPVEIVFGDDGGDGPGDAVELQAAGSITGLRAPILLRSGVRAFAAGQITGLRLVAAAQYDVNVTRPVVGTVAQRWQDAVRRGMPARERYQAALPLQAAIREHWQDAGALGAAILARYEAAAMLSVAVRQGWQQAARLSGPGVRQGFEEALPLRHAIAQHWQDAARRSMSRAQRFQEALPVRRVIAQHWQEGLRVSAVVTDGMGIAVARSRAWRNHYQEAWVPRPGVSTPTRPPQPDPCYVPEVPVHLVFDALADHGVPAHLVFLCEGHGTDPEPGEPQYVIPLLRVYMTVHTIDAVLLPSLERVQLQGITINADDDGYGWSMTGSGPLHLMDQLQPVNGLPPRVRVTIDGIAWVFVIDPPERSRKFGDMGVQVRGSSATALLGAPHMPSAIWSNSLPMTAQQLVAQALEFTGVNIDWGISDWLVPPGAWSHQGTPLSAALRIAEAAGAALRSHRTDATLQFAPRYPHLPWAWPAATPNVRMPGQIITTDTLQHVAATAYNAVYVVGETTGGVMGRVVRAGSAGDVLAPQVTDPLITHETAARQRGSTVLASAAITRRQSITVPLLTGGTHPGLILPGYLVEVVEPDETWRGLVRGITVTAGLPTVRQSLAVERAV